MTNTYNTLSELFSGIADAIRNKTGGTEKIVADDFPEKIAGIESAKVANGIINPGKRTTTIEITGIGFKPKELYIFAPSFGYDDYSIMSGIWKEDGTTFGNGHGDDNSIIYYSLNGVHIQLVPTYAEDTLTVKVKLSTDARTVYFSQTNYYWVAFG